MRGPPLARAWPAGCTGPPRRRPRTAPRRPRGRGARTRPATRSSLRIASHRYWFLHFQASIADVHIVSVFAHLLAVEEGPEGVLPRGHAHRERPLPIRERDFHSSGADHNVRDDTREELIA